MITNSIEINRRPEDVFAYIDQLDRHGEWQEQIVDVKLEPPGPTSVGTRSVETRNFNGRHRQMTFEVTAHDPPRTTSFHGIDGPLRPVGTVRVEPAGDGSRSRLTIDFDLESHGFFGMLLGPLARRQARSQIPKDHARLKAQLEGGA